MVDKDVIKGYLWMMSVSAGLFLGVVILVLMISSRVGTAIFFMLLVLAALAYPTWVFVEKLKDKESE